MRTKRLIVAAVVGSIYAGVLISLGREVFVRQFLPDIGLAVWLVGSSLVAGTSLAAVIALANRGSEKSIVSAFFWCIIGFIVSPSVLSRYPSSVPEAFFGYGFFSMMIVWGLSVLARLHLQGGPMTTAASQPDSAIKDAPEKPSAAS